MASDNLNEVGKYISKSRDHADRALKRSRPNRPGVERTRDIFDPVVPFSMNFNVAKTQKRVSLDLEFNKPPPGSNCMTGSDIRMSCESFTVESGDHELRVSQPYFPGTLAVYVNGTTWALSKWAEIDSGDGIVLVTQLPLALNSVTICYMRYFDTENCANPTPTCHYPAPNTIHGGILLGLSQGATSDQYGYIHYMRGGVSMPDEPYPWYPNGGLHTSMNRGNGWVALACKMGNMVRMITVGNGTITPYMGYGNINESGHALAGYYNFEVWHKDPDTDAHVTDFVQYNIDSNDPCPTVTITGYPEICTHYSELSGFDFQVQQSQFDPFRFWILYGGFDWVLA